MRKSVMAAASAVALGVGGYLAYDTVFATTAAEEFTLGTGSTAGGGSNSPPGIDVAGLTGTWVAVAQSEAGYRIVEDTPTGEKTVTGRTNQVEASVTFADGALTSTEVGVAMATIASDQPRRDDAFRESIMRTSEFPRAVFTQAGSVKVEGRPTATVPIRFEVPGTLELRGTSKPATVRVDAVSDGTNITVVGTVEVALADFGIDPPAIPGVITVRDTGTVEFKLVLERG